MVLQVGDVFPSIDDARNAITQHVLDASESYKALKSEKKKYIIVCKDKSAKCTFRIQASSIVKKGFVITIFKPHTCCPTVHYKNKKCALSQIPYRASPCFYH